MWVTGKEEKKAEKSNNQLKKCYFMRQKYK